METNENSEYLYLLEVFEPYINNALAFKTKEEALNFISGLTGIYSTSYEYSSDRYYYKEDTKKNFRCSLSVQKVFNNKEEAKKQIQEDLKKTLENTN